MGETEGKGYAKVSSTPTKAKAYKTLSKVKKPACKAACDKDPKCQGYKFTTGTNTCHLLRHSQGKGVAKARKQAVKKAMKKVNKKPKEFAKKKAAKAKAKALQMKAAREKTAKAIKKKVLVKGEKMAKEVKKKRKGA